MGRIMEKINAYKKGFTLIEVIVVSVIVAILAIAATLMYSGYVSSAKMDNGRSKLELIGAAVMHTHNRGTDIGASGSGGWTKIGIPDPSDNNWSYTFGALGGTDDPSGFNITATGDEGNGDYLPNQPAGSRWTGVFD